MGVTDYSVDGDVVARLLSAALIGGLIGAEREATDQPAGLRTHIAVALGAALFGVISTLGFDEFDRPRSQSTLQADVTRVASNVAVGIGFLGAGVIWRQGSAIRNLTTAASLWTVAAIGLAAGVGDVSTAAIAAAVLLVSLVVLRPIRSLIAGRLNASTSDLRVLMGRGDTTSGVVGAVEGTEGVELKHVRIDNDEDGLTLTLTVEADRDTARDLVGGLATLPGVRRVDEA